MRKKKAHSQWDKHQSRQQRTGQRKLWTTLSLDGRLPSSPAPGHLDLQLLPPPPPPLSPCPIFLSPFCFLASWGWAAQTPWPSCSRPGLHKGAYSPGSSFSPSVGPRDALHQVLPNVSESVSINKDGPGAVSRPSFLLFLHFTMSYHEYVQQKNRASFTYNGKIK